jgi:hypothetical protein
MLVGTTIICHFGIERLVKIFFHHPINFLFLSENPSSSLASKVDVEEAICLTSGQKLGKLRSVLRQQLGEIDGFKMRCRDKLDWRVHGDIRMRHSSDAGVDSLV